MAAGPPQLSSSEPARDDGSEWINEYDKSAHEYKKWGKLVYSEQGEMK